MKEIDLRFGVETGQWQTVAEHSGSGTFSSTGGSGNDVVISKAFQAGEKTHINVMHQIKGRSVRVIAINKERKVHSTSGQSSGGNNAIQVSAEFSRPLDKIKTLRLQRRAMVWTTIRNSFQTRLEHSAQKKRLRMAVGINA